MYLPWVYPGSPWKGAVMTQEPYRMDRSPPRDRCQWSCRQHQESMDGKACAPGRKGCFRPDTSMRSSQGQLSHECFVDLKMRAQESTHQEQRAIGSCGSRPPGQRSHIYVIEIQSSKRRIPFDITARFLHVLSGEVFRCVRIALEACFKGAPLMPHMLLSRIRASQNRQKCGVEATPAAGNT